MVGGRVRDLTWTLYLRGLVQENIINKSSTFILRIVDFLFVSHFGLFSLAPFLRIVTTFPI